MLLPVPLSNKGREQACTLGNKLQSLQNLIKELNLKNFWNNSPNALESLRQVSTTDVHMYKMQ